MKKNYIITLIFMLLVLSLVYNIFEDNKRVDSFFKFHRDISDIVIVNNKLNKFVSAPIGFKNFDYIKNDIDSTQKSLKSIEDGDLVLFLKNKEIRSDFYILKKLLNEKILLIEKLKSHSAILNNSFRNIIKLYPQIENKKYIDIYTKVISLNINSELSYINLFESYEKLTFSNNSEKLFLAHIRVIIDKIKVFKQIKSNIKELDADKKIELFEKKYSSFVKTLISDVKDTILLLVILLSLIIAIFLIYSYRILKDKIELKRFRNAVENSDNYIVVTDANKKIKYVNSSMLNAMGFTPSEVIGKDPSIFRAGFIPRDTYKSMNKTIFSGKKWTGEFINKTKDGEILYEKASITPILDKNGNIDEFLGIKLNITKEKEILNSLKEKDHRLTQQAKLVIMNEILNSIAHQWRQPLSIISTATSGLLIHKEYETLNDAVFEELTNTIMQNTLYLSSTIDNFKSFFKTGNDVTLFNIKESFEKAYKLIEFRLLNDDIIYEINAEEIYLKGIENDLIQVIVNLFNNAIEALESLTTKKRYLLVSVEKDNEYIIIKIKDNAQGIEEKNLTKIFQPYFTTKYNSQGTGMGLYMCHEIITKQFNGKIILKNVDYLKNNEDNRGVEIIILLPLPKDIV